MDGTDDGAAPTSDEPTAPPDGADPASRRSRRWFVAGGLALLAGAGAGVAAGSARGTSDSATPTPIPRAVRAQVVAALADERRLVTLARSAHRYGADPVVAAALLRDHETHLAALTAAVRELAPSAVRPTPHPTATPPPQQPVHDRAGLRRAEQQAAQRAADRAARLAGHRQSATIAVLLASIAACESTHAELLHA